MTKLNVELLRKIKAHILEEPRRYVQSTWGYRIVGDERVASDPPCGMAACIAGWALALSDVPLFDEDGYRVVGIPSRAAALIGVKDGYDPKVGYMFSGSGGDWAEPFAKRFIAAQSQAELAQVAADYIDFVIETLGTEDNKTDASTN